MKKPNLSACLAWLILLISFLPVSLQAQQVKDDVIYLKNGGILRGDLLPQDTLGIMKIKILGDNILAFPVSEVSSVSKEPRKKKHRIKSFDPRPINYKEKGYYNLTLLGLAIGGNYYNSIGYEEGSLKNVGFRFTNGYRFHRLIAAGIGVGLNFYPQGPMLPIYLEARGDLLKKPVTPHYYGNIGYSQPLYRIEQEGWQTDAGVKGGMLYEAGLGVKFNSRGNIAFLFTAGLRTQSVTEYYSNEPDNSVETTFSFNRISVQAGLMF